MSNWFITVGCSPTHPTPLNTWEDAMNDQLIIDQANGDDDDDDDNDNDDNDDDDDNGDDDDDDDANDNDDYCIVICKTAAL